MSKPRILIVEDQTIIALDYKSRVEKMGYEVIDIVMSGEDALKKAREQKPDLILMDITLEGNIDGIQAAEELMKNDGISVIYLTAHANDTVIERYMTMKPHAYLMKPVKDNDLQKAIQDVLGRVRP